MDIEAYDSAAIKGTPFHPRTAPLNTRRRWVVWDRRAMAEVYSESLAELQALRQTAGLLDMSPLSKTLISGRDAQRFVNYVITRDAAALAVGQVYYSPLCNDQGKVVADGIVYRRDADSFLFSADPHLNWLRRNAGGFAVQIEDVTERYGILAVQGPQARAVLEAAGGGGLSSLKFSRGTSLRVGKARVEVLRQGFTGEPGYELWVEAGDAVAVWDAVTQAGRPLGMLPCGNTVMDWARVEAGLLIVGPDYTSARLDRLGTPMNVSEENEAYPTELGLDGFLDFDKDNFVGKQALQALAAGGGPPRRLVGLALDWQEIVAHYSARGLAPEIPRRPRWYPLAVFAGERRAGRATSVTWSPTLRKIVGFGHVERALAEPGARLSIDWDFAGERGRVSATVVRLPFMDPRRSPA